MHECQITKEQNTNYQNTNVIKYKRNKIQMKQNTKETKYKWNKIQIEQNAKISKYKHDKNKIQRAKIHK